ncbi:50S ribosomal protein L5 [Candidatus Woesearchaeota archaeon]|jgi:large subunit ribosomal protein L5|nr:50S ribosomal protein L5 [Candidatus Woesearchaeota archaeon]
MTETKSNLMNEIKVAKITLNIGSGKEESRLKKALKLLQKLAPNNPVKTTAKKRIPGWGLRPGLPIGCKVTIRKDCDELIKRLFAAKENTLPRKKFDSQGNFSFGIPEYIEITGLEYDPELKIMGLEVAVTLERPGFRIKKRRNKQQKIGKNQLISQEDAINFVQQKFNVQVN